MTTKADKPNKNRDEELIGMLKYLRLRKLLSHWEE